MHILTDALRAISRAELEKFAQQKKVELKDMPANEKLNYDHWIVGIMMKSSVVNISFRIHFASDISRMLAAQGLDQQPENLSPSACHDFMQEYSNFTVGALKRYLLDGGLTAKDFDLRPEVPQKEPSYDRTDIKMELKNEVIHDCWKLTFAKGHVICVAAIKIQDLERLKGIDALEVSTLSVSDVGNIEFF